MIPSYVSREPSAEVLAGRAMLSLCMASSRISFKTSGYFRKGGSVTIGPRWRGWMNLLDEEPDLREPRVVDL